MLYNIIKFIIAFIIALFISIFSGFIVENVAEEFGIVKASNTLLSYMFYGFIVAIFILAFKIYKSF